MLTTNDFMRTYGKYYTRINPNTKASTRLLYDFNCAKIRGITDVREAYQSCSQIKKDTFDEIWERATSQGADEVYISGASSTTYSTIYEIELLDDDNGDILTCVIKDTYRNTYFSIY